MADAFEDEVEPAVTIDEYFDNFEAEELEADLVLGGDEGKVCTYDMGYMKRQAIFSCLTCTPDGNAGFCTACSLSCHDGHEIVELWTKRNFRCDCGNSKFGEFFCKIFPNKDVENVENSYNHNFKGLYCTCGRPYPDPDVEDQEEMIQCIMCEDWFHEKHIGLESPNEIPTDEEGEPAYEDFICKACSGVCSFLRLYPKKIWATTSQSSDVAGKDKGVLQEGPSVLVTEDAEDSICLDKEHLMPNAHCQSLSGVTTFANGESSGSKIRTDDGMTSANSDDTTCVLGGADAVNVLPPSEDKPMFLSKGWREFLCRCGKCVDMYSTKHISYLLIKEDSIAEYENMAKKKREEKLHQDGDESSFLDKLGHVEKMEVLHGIADLKDEFRSFLESSDPSKTITASDVHKMFENLAKKRQRLQ